MKKISFILFILILSFEQKLNAETINQIYEGNIDAKVTIITYESLTCNHCADFHKNVYPDLKKEFIDTGIIKIEFKYFPLDMAAFNAAKIAQCRNDGKSDILHILFSNQKEWVKGNTIDDLNSNLKKFVENKNLNIDFEKCINDKKIEDFVLNNRIDGVKKFEVESLGKLDNILKRGINKYDTIFIDEAHRFRNEYTHGFEKLTEITYGKKVVLVTATPLNNSFHLRLRVDAQVRYVKAREENPTSYCVL